MKCNRITSRHHNQCILATAILIITYKMCSGTNASNKKTSTDTSKCKRVCAAIVAQLPEWSLLTIGDLGSNPAITTFYTDHWFIGNCLTMKIGKNRPPGMAHFYLNVKTVLAKTDHFILRMSVDGFSYQRSFFLSSSQVWKFIQS